jgi:hypothetical protein
METSQVTRMGVGYEITKDEAVAVLPVFIGRGFRNFDSIDAVTHLISSTRDRDRGVAASKAISMCLELLYVSKTSQRHLFTRVDILSLALELSKFPGIKHGCSVRLVHEAACAGFHGRFPELPKRLLGRDMNGEDVIALIDSYVSNAASQCSSDEEKLIQWATACLPEVQAEEQIERIKAFKREWSRHVDY